MLQAILYGSVSGLALVIGAVAGLFINFRQKVIAGFMAFGSGVLICALTFGLMEEAFKHGGFDAVIIGFISGGVLFILGDYALHYYGGRRHKRRQFLSPGKSSDGAAITLGTVFDGIPESVGLGVALFAGQGTGLLLLAGIILSNFPEGISSISGLIKEGFSKQRILLIWSSVALIVAATTVLSYLFLREIDPNILGVLESFAAGAILAMLADTMMPEAYEEGGFLIGLATVLGFLLAFIISR